MPAINFLSTSTIPGIASHSGKASSFSLPINNVVNRPEVLLRDKSDDSYNAHEMAYAGQKPPTSSHDRMKRDTIKISNIVKGSPTRENCNLANKLDIHLHRLEKSTGLTFPNRKELHDYYNSSKCRHTLNSKRRFKPENWN